MTDVQFSSPEDSGTMPADNTPPIRKTLAAESKGIATDPINVAIAREVLGRGGEGSYLSLSKTQTQSPEQGRFLQNNPNPIKAPSCHLAQQHR